MITSPLLRNVRHRAMITPVCPLCTRLIHISSSWWIIYRSFEIILENWNCPLDWTSNPMFCTNPLLQNTLSPIQIIFLKILNWIGQLWLWWMSRSKARANEVDRTPAANHIVLFKSPATWPRKVRHATKIYEQWQGPKKRSEVKT